MLKYFYSRAIGSHQQLLLQIVSFQSSELFNDGSGVKSPCELIRHVDPQEFKGAYSFYGGPFDQKWWSLCLLPPEIDDQLFGFCGVQFQVVVMPRCQSLSLLSVVLFITLCNETNDCRVVC